MPTRTRLIRLSTDAVRVLHLCPEDPTASGIAGYGAGFRAGVSSAGVEIDLVATPSGPSTVQGIRRYCRAVVQAARSYDLIHAELGGADLHRFYATLAVIHSGQSVFATLHDPARVVWSPFTTAAVASRPRSLAAMRRLTDVQAKQLEAHLLHHCASLFTLSHGGSRGLAQYFRLGVSPNVLPYPVDGQPPAPAVDPAASLRVGFFGFWYQGKGLDTLLNALAVLRREGRQITAEISGKAPGLHPAAARAYQKGIEAQVERLGLQELLTTHGYVEHGEYQRLMRSCHIVVLAYPPVPTLLSTSASMYEALTVGRPVVAFDTRTLSETIHDGHNGLLLDPHDDLGLVKALRRLHDDVALRGRLADGAAETGGKLSTHATGLAARAVYETVKGAASPTPTRGPERGQGR